MNAQINSSLKIDDRPDQNEHLDLGRLAQSLGFLTRMAQLEIFGSYHAELGGYGLKPGEFSVFWLVGQHPGIRQGLVARNLRIKQAHMTKLVRGLEKRELMSRVVPDNDRRSVLLETTEQGQAYLEEIQDAFFNYSISDTNTLTKAETKTLIELLQKFTGIREGNRQ